MQVVQKGMHACYTIQGLLPPEVERSECEEAWGAMVWARWRMRGMVCARKNGGGVKHC